MINRLRSILAKDEVAGAGIFFAVALAIMLPLLGPGYLLALDMNWTPHFPLSAVSDNTYLFFGLLHFLTLFLPSQAVQKALLIAILWLAGWGVYRLASGKRKQLSIGAVFGGLLYTINPFVYSHFLSGQFQVLAGYALMPWFVTSLWSFFDRPRLSSALKLAVWAIIISIVLIHAIFFMAMIVCVSVAVAAITRKKLDWVGLLKWGGAAAAVWLLASSYWFIPTITGHSNDAQLVGQFDNRYVEAFQTATDPHYGVVFNAAAMYGFWVDREGSYTLPKDHLVLWPVLAGLFIALAVAGLVIARRRPLAWSLAVIGVMSLVLGVGIAYGPFAGMYNWCIGHIPLFKGYREPQKFIGLLILAYAFLGATGVDWIVKFIKDLFGGRMGLVIGSYLLPILFVALPVAYMPGMLWGFNGQIPPTQYPSDWYSLNRALDADHANFQVLFLPWHQYTSFSFTNGIIANPAQNFFDKPVIQGNNLELGSIYSQESSPASRLVEGELLKPGVTFTNAGAKLVPLKVKYVILAKNFDAGGYAWLDKQSDLKLIRDSATLKVYQNEAWRP